MKHHLVALGGKALDASAGLVTAPFIPDNLIRASSNIMQLTDDWWIMGSYVGGVGLSRVRVSSARSRLFGYPNLVPVFSSTLGGSRPPINDMRDNPIKLYNGENVTIQVTNGAANNVIVLLNMTRDTPNYNINIPSVRKVRFTASLTSVEFTWGPESNIVLDDDLDAGTYGVFGCYVNEADAIASRLVFNNQVERPGSVSIQADADVPSALAMGELGLWGTFESITPPFIQSMHVASAAQTLTGYLLIGKM